ncbi:MAG: DUF4956 domain-containing protein [Gemmatimonadales bacterium]
MSATDSVDSPSAYQRQLARRALFRLVRWYALVLVVFGVGWWLLTVLPPATAKGASSVLTGEGALAEPSAMLPRMAETGSVWIAALIQMLAALLLVVPLAGTYVLTRARPKYDRTLVQTVIVLPVAITAVLMMVSHSLALAFGLAGVVGAVRFRSTLDEAGDTVYIFTAIVIGFAAGIHAVGIAVILSILFVTLELSMWYWDVASPSARYWQHVTSSQSRNTGPFQVPVSAEPAREQILRVDAKDLAAAEPLTAEALAKYTKRYQLVGRSQADHKAGTLEYAVRLRKQMGWQEVSRRLKEVAGGTIRSVQWHAASNAAPPAKQNGKPGGNPR